MYERNSSGKVSVLIREVSSFEGVSFMGFLERCPHFMGVFREGLCVTARVVYL